MAPKIRKPSGKPEPLAPPSLADLEAELERRQNPSPPTLAEAHIPTMPNTSRLGYAGVGKRLHGPVVRGDLRFGFPFLSWDAWMSLHHIAQEPLEHNQDGSIPARWFKPLEQRLVPLPPLVGVVVDPIHRVRAALHILDDLKLLTSRKGPSSDNPNFCVSPVGKELLDAGRVPFFERVLGYTGLASFDPARSEEHTSELQSRQYLVCRLLLEQKK